MEEDGMTWKINCDNEVCMIPTAKDGPAFQRL